MYIRTWGSNLLAVAESGMHLVQVRDLEPPGCSLIQFDAATAQQLETSEPAPGQRGVVIAHGPLAGYQYLKAKTPGSFHLFKGHFLCAEPPVGPTVYGNRELAGPWETFRFIDRDAAAALADEAGWSGRRMARWEAMTPEEVLDFFKDFGRTVRSGALGVSRHHYALGLAQAARMAIHCGNRHISAVELGVFRGEGLLELCKAAEYLTDKLGMKFAVYGFDTATGLPALEGYMDHPEIWHANAFKMPDLAELRAKLPPFAKLVIGDVGETLPAFKAELMDAPLGFVSFDVDLYSSTKRALQILQYPPACYQPGVALLFDDTHTSLTHSDWCGEAAAVREFNDEHALRKIDRKPTFQINKFAVGQIFDHPMRQGTAKSRWGLTLGSF